MKVIQKQLILNCTIRVYTEIERGKAWLQRQQGQPARFACILGFTETALIEGISAAGATPEQRKYTAIADAEFLLDGPKPNPRYPLPPLQKGLSPVLISRTAIAAAGIPVYLFNAGLPEPPAVEAIALPGEPAACLSSGRALPRATVDRLFAAGLRWGEQLGSERGYLIIGECVVGGTTTALGVLTALGIDAVAGVSSSQLHCDRALKENLVQQGLTRAGLLPIPATVDPLEILAAVGDPMQVAAAGMALAASRCSDVLLAGGTQMLAVYAVMDAIARYHHYAWNRDRVVVGTTRWVVEDGNSDAIGLARAVGGVPFLATQLDFSTSRYSQLRAYERGYVKEGVGAGGCAIAAHLNPGLNAAQLLERIESLTEETYRKTGDKGWKGRSVEEGGEKC